MLLVRRRLAAIIVGAAALAPLATLASGVGAPVALGADGLQFRTASRYVLVPERGVVRVTIDVTLTNLQPDRVRGDTRTATTTTGSRWLRRTSRATSTRPTADAA